MVELDPKEADHAGQQEEENDHAESTYLTSGSRGERKCIFSKQGRYYTSPQDSQPNPGHFVQENLGMTGTHLQM